MKFQVTWIQYYTEFHVLTGTKSTKTFAGWVDAPLCAFNTVNKRINIAAAFVIIKTRYAPWCLCAECRNVVRQPHRIQMTALKDEPVSRQSWNFQCAARRIPPIHKTSQTTDDQRQHTATVDELHVHVGLLERNQSVSFLAKIQRDIEASRIYWFITVSFSEVLHNS